MDKTIYDISQYTDQELYRMLDLDHPTDRELEMKIIVLIQKYQEMDNPMGRQMSSFFNDIYHHFFEDDVDETEAEVVEETEEAGVEGFENPTVTTPPVIQTSGNWTGAELDILPDSEVSRGTAITAGPSQKAGVASENTVQVGINTSYGSSLQNKQIGYQKSLDYTKGSLNPIIKETIQRVISIDSQFRDVNVYPYSTDFTFNLSDTLQDVVSLKLYSVQIPFTWYTVSNAYGSNFMFLNGNSPGIMDTGNYNISINIPSGNYQANELILALNNAFKTSMIAYPDIYFGPTSEITYNPVNSRAKITLDIQQIYNESYYYVDFPEYNPQLIDQEFIKFSSTPYMKFQCIHPDYTNVLNDISLVVPPPVADSSNIQNLYVTSYGYNVSSFISTITTIFNNPYSNIHNSVFNFSSSTIKRDISQNIMLNYEFNYTIPAQYYSNELNIIKPNFRFEFVSYTDNSYSNTNLIKKWSGTAWNTIFETPNQTDDSVFFTVNSDKIIQSMSITSSRINISSTNSTALTLLITDDEGLNIINQLNTSWYDTCHNCFVDQSFNNVTVPNRYFYDVHSLVIQIIPIGKENEKVQPVKIPVILDGSGLEPNDTNSGIAIEPSKLINLINKTLTNNAKQLARNYRIYIKPNPFTFTSSKISFDASSISQILTEKDYKISFYDTNGYQEDKTNVWKNIQNVWSNYLSIPDASYVLSVSNQIHGSSPFVDILSTPTRKIFPNLENYSLQSFLGYWVDTDSNNVNTQYFSYNIATWTSNTFLGFVYNSNLQFPYIDISSIYINGSSVFDIYLYQSTITDTVTTTDYSSTSSMIDSSYSITYSGLSNKQSVLTFQQIIDSINASFQSYGVFTKDSGIHIIDSSSGDVITNPSLIEDNVPYYYQCKIQFDRKKIKPKINMKTYMKINDIHTWLTYFKFNIPVTYTSNKIEFSEIVSKTPVLSNTSNISTYPYVYLRCITPGYSGYAYNDISFTLPSSPVNIGYTMSQYLNLIQSSMTKPEWGLTGIADLGGPESSFRMGININHIIPSTTNGQSNFSIDFSKSVLYQMNPSMNWKIDSSNVTTIFNNLVFSQTYNVVKNVSDLIQITVKGPHQGIDGAYYSDDVSVFTTNFRIPAAVYTLNNLITAINTTVFGHYTISDSSFNLKGNNIPPNGINIPNGRVNMYGSFMTANVNPTDITMNNIEFNFSIRSILTSNDYHLEFYDPYWYKQNPKFGPGLLNKASSNGNNNIVSRYVTYDISNTSVNYMNIGDNNTTFPQGTWQNTSNSWYNYLYISDSSYLLIKQPMGVASQNVKYTYIYGTKTITDQKLNLTTNNNYLTIKPNYDSNGGVFVTNPSDYNGIYSSDNDIVITLDPVDLPLNTWYNSEEIISGFNKQFNLNPITKGSYMYIDRATHHTVIRLNVNKIFTAQDYSLVFYESSLFTHCSYGSNPSIQTTTQDTTLGWLLGFRNLPIYNLNSDLITEYNKHHNYAINYTFDICNNIVSIVGDTSVSITLYNYFLIILDDYTQSHLNDGLVTVNSSTADISLPSYANRNTYRCNADFSQNNSTKDLTYIGNSRDSTSNNNLTLKQLYSANQILNTQQNNNKTHQVNMGIYVQNIFGIIPVKTSGLINGQTYVEFGGTLQNQDRTYFGPVNIKRMAVRILTDKGNILNLNNANISFSLIAQQLYNPYARG